MPSHPVGYRSMCFFKEQRQGIITAYGEVYPLGNRILSFQVTSKDVGNVIRVLNDLVASHSSKPDNSAWFFVHGMVNIWTALIILQEAALLSDKNFKQIEESFPTFIQRAEASFRRQTTHRSVFLDEDEDVDEGVDEGVNEDVDEGVNEDVDEGVNEGEDEGEYEGEDEASDEDLVRPSQYYRR